METGLKPAVPWRFKFDSYPNECWLMPGGVKKETTDETGVKTITKSSGSDSCQLGTHSEKKKHTKQRVRYPPVQEHTSDVFRGISLWATPFFVFLVIWA